MNNIRIEVIITSNETHYDTEDLKNFCEMFVWRMQNHGGPNQIAPRLWDENRYRINNEHQVQVIYFRSAKERIVKINEPYQLAAFRLSLVRPEDLSESPMQQIAIQKSGVVPYSAYPAISYRLCGLFGISNPAVDFDNMPYGSVQYAHEVVARSLWDEGVRIRINEKPGLDKKAADHIRTVTNLQVRREGLQNQLATHRGSLLSALSTYESNELALRRCFEQLKAKNIDVDESDFLASNKRVSEAIERWRERRDNKVTVDFGEEEENG